MINLQNNKWLDIILYILGWFNKIMKFLRRKFNIIKKHKLPPNPSSSSQFGINQTKWGDICYAMIQIT